MMVPAWVEPLGRRAVAAPAWQWVSGMMILGGERIFERYMFSPGVEPPAGYPNLDDPATFGAMVALVRLVRRESIGYVAPVAERGYVWFAHQHCRGQVEADTPAECVVKALEAVNTQP